MPTPPTAAQASRDLRTFLQRLEAHQQLTTITAPASPHLTITEITDRITKGDPAHNKALLFTAPQTADTAYPVPLLINAYGSHQRMAWAIGAENDYSEIAERIAFFAKPPFGTLSGGSLWDKLSLLPKASEVRYAFPTAYHGSVAPCQEVVITDTTQPMLDKLPILTCWPDDGGPYITLGAVFTKDALTKERNLGMYRLQKYDNCTTGMHWQKHHDGARLYEAAKAQGRDRVEVAVVLGAPPSVTYAATAPLPPGLDELLLAGFVQKQGVAMVPCKTIDMKVPAHSEIVLEGYVLLDELRREGPFGDHTGYYSLADDYPVFHLTAMTHRKNPIYQTTIVGKPPQEDCYLGKATERLFLPLLKLFLSDIVDMSLPWEGVFHNCVILSIDKRYPGQGKKVMCSLWGFGQLMFSKYVIVVDKHVNIHNPAEVAWHVFNNTDPRRDTMMVDGPMDALDHATPLWAYGSKLGIDATRKWESEGFTRDWPEEIHMAEAVRQQVEADWATWFGHGTPLQPKAPY
jgi:4-hydroxy-3-polyprenylbenzoate decarboxylase